MAEVVGGFLMPHVPSIPLGGYGEDPEKKAAVDNAFAQISKRVTELEADTVIIIGDDHYENFGPNCIPTCLIVTGDVDISAHARTLGIEGGPIANNEPLARHILDTGYGDDIDWAFAKSLAVDHSVGVPHHMSVKMLSGVKTIPIYLNCVVQPIIRSRRAYQIGQSILRAVQSWSGDERVVLFGTGGISHWVGAPKMGHVNEDFDHRILDMVAKGDVDGLIALPDQVILGEAGNGALEIKNWICALGAMPAGTTAETIAYEPIPQWVTGCGFFRTQGGGVTGQGRSMVRNDTAQSDKVIGAAVTGCRLVFGTWNIFFGLVFYLEFIPQPMGHGELTPYLNQTLIDTHLFHVVKAIEIVVGLSLLMNRAVPLMLCVYFPITFVIFFVNLFLEDFVFGPMIAFIYLGVHMFMMWAYRKYYLPMLAWRASISPGVSLPQ